LPLYNNIFSRQCRSNSYVLYYEFFRRLFEYECQRIHEGTLYEEEALKMLDEMASYAFIKYKNCLCKKDWKKFLQEKRETWNESQRRIAGMILERQTGEFLHHSYEEFFVAFHYILNVIESKKNINDITDVLSCLYNNAYSDFISKGLSVKLDEESKKRKVTQTLLYVYYFTLQGKLQQELLLLRDYGLDTFVSSVDKKHLGKNKKVINQLDEKEYFYLKYEIPFRLGRLGTTYPLEFLCFVYKHENGKGAFGYKFDAYKLAILKRQCAISASFLCGDEIELDYVKKMLPYMPQYDMNYDLVNRSHTLIYYGDVLNTDLLKFRDDGEADWKQAREKRIQRLKKKAQSYTLDDRVACFRLFDLATLYTFLFSRQNSYCLTEEEKNVVHSAKTKGISQMPLAREELMCQLKNRIVQGEYH